MPDLILWGASALLLAGVMSLAWGIQRATGQGAWVDALWTFGVGAAGLLGEGIQGLLQNRSAAPGGDDRDDSGLHPLDPKRRRR